MLVILSVSLALVAVAIAATAKVTQAVMYRLGLDTTTVLLWLGLAEWPARRGVSRSHLVPDRPPRRSPHRRIRRLSARRRPTVAPPAH